MQSLHPSFVTIITNSRGHSAFISQIFRDTSGYANLDFKSRGMTLVKCPKCGREVEFEGNDFRPFCSERCKMLDFGAWADEDYALPTEVSDLSERDWEEIEKALKDGDVS